MIAKPSVRATRSTLQTTRIWQSSPRATRTSHLEKTPELISARPNKEPFQVQKSGNARNPEMQKAVRGGNVDLCRQGNAEKTLQSAQNRRGEMEQTNPSAKHRHRKLHCD